MIVKLSLGDIERARLVLRGGSVLDWHRFEVTTAEECDAILRANGFHPENEEDAVHLRYIRMSAVDYLMRNCEISFAPEILNAESTSSLMLLAAGDNSILRQQACSLLKVMHVVHHVEARDLKSRLNISDSELYHSVEEKVANIVREMQIQGYPILNFQSSHKTRDSIITKLLSKRQGNRAFLYDIIRFRIVTATIEEIVPVVAYLSRELFPFHYTVSGESHNSIFDFKDFIQRHPHISGKSTEFEVDLMYEKDMHAGSNLETSSSYKSAKFIIDLPIRLEDHQLEVWAPGLTLSSRVVHVPAEFHIVDHASNIRNEQGDASHEMYKARRIARVRDRLLGGKTAGSGNVDY
jgi:uncharacterized protein (TIGR04552 family)